jgi:hypothetical protein
MSTATILGGSRPLAQELAPAPGATPRSTTIIPGEAGVLLDQLGKQTPPATVAQALRLLHPVVRNVLLHPRLAEFVLFTGGIQRFAAGAHIPL